MAIVYIDNKAPSSAVKMVLRSLGVAVEYRNVEEFKEHKMYIEREFGESTELPIVYNEYGTVVCKGFKPDTVIQEFK